MTWRSDEWSRAARNIMTIGTARSGWQMSTPVGAFERTLRAIRKAVKTNFSLRTIDGDSPSWSSAACSTCTPPSSSAVRSHSQYRSIPPPKPVDGWKARIVEGPNRSELVAVGREELDPIRATSFPATVEGSRIAQDLQLYRG